MAIKGRIQAFWRQLFGTEANIEANTEADSGVSAEPAAPSPADDPAPASKLDEIATAAFVAMEGGEGADVAQAEEQTATPLAFRAVRGGLWLLGSSYWSLIFGFTANILLTRLLTPQIYGEFALAMFFYTLFQLRGKLGLNYAFAHDKRINGESIGTYFTLDMALGIGGLALTLIAAPILLYLNYSPAVVAIAVILAIVALFESLLGVFGVVLETELRFKPGSIISSVAMPLSYIPAFWFALHNYGQYSLVAQAVTFSLVSQLAGAVYIARRMRSLFHLRWRYRSQLAMGYLRFGATTGIGSFVAGLVTQIDNFILGTISGVTVLGYYDRAYRIAQWPGILLNAVVGRAAVFTYSQLRGDTERLQRSSTMLLWSSANVAFPVVLALFVSAPDFVPLLFGTQWLPVVPILRIMLIASVLRPLWENMGALFIGMGKPRRVVEVSVVQIVVLVGIGTPLAMRSGATGMAAGVTMASFVAVALAYYLLRKMLPLNPWDILAAPVLASGLTLIGYWFVVRAVGSSYPLWFAVIWKVAFVLVAYALLVLVVQPRKSSERIRYILRLLRGPTG